MSFFAAAHGANTFFVDWDGTQIAGSPGSLPSTIPQAASDFTGDYRQYTFDVTATGSSSTLAFGGTDPDTPGMGPNSILIDDVSLSAVPEPSAWALMILGVGLLGLRMRRRAVRAGSIALKGAALGALHQLLRIRAPHPNIP